MMNEHGWQFALVILSAIVASMITFSFGMRVPTRDAQPIEGAIQTAANALREATTSRNHILLSVGFFSVVCSWSSLPLIFRPICAILV